MPLKVVVELQIHAVREGLGEGVYVKPRAENPTKVSCPGVYLTEKSDVYLHVCILGQCKETDCLPPIFPLLFHEKMWFEKIFEKATDPVAVVELLEKNVTKIRLSELISSEKGELAFYEENTRDFLFPEPKLTPPYPGVDRELLMNTPPSFPGIAPKLEFSTRTTITELPLLPRRWYHDRNKTKLQRAASASPRRRSISPARCRMAKSKSCKRFTRILRSRSPSPSPAKCHHERYRESQQQPSPLSPRSVKFKAEADHRPPFVVRHGFFPDNGGYDCNLKCNPVLVYSKENPAEFSWAYYQVDTYKTFGEQTPPQVPFRNARQSTSPSRNSHKSQLKRALSFDSWKATCPAAKVIREPDEQYSSDPVLPSSPESKEPVNYPRNTHAISHKASFDSSKRYRSPSPRGRWAQQRIYYSPNSSWEEINERVRNLLTSDEARQRLSIGATDLEIDEVLERRSISLRSSPQCDSMEKRYYS